MPKFDKSKRYQNKNGSKFGGGVWLDDSGKPIMPGRGVYDKNSKTVRQYNSDGTITTFTRQDWVKKQQRDHEIRVLQNDRKYAAPYLPEKAMTIHTNVDGKAGRINLSENQLDSIAVNAKRAGLPFQAALGIAYKESTLGQHQDRKAGTALTPWLETISNPFDKSNSQAQQARKVSYIGVQSPTLLISNWKQQYESPYAEYSYDSKLNLRDSKQSKEGPRTEQYYDDHFLSSLYWGNRYAFKEENPLEHGFREYKKNPSRWNSGEPGYEEDVQAKGKQLMQSPEIQEYVKRNNVKSEGGFLQPKDAWDALSMREKAAMLKVAVRNGITSLQDIRQKYNEFAEGGDVKDEEKALPPIIPFKQSMEVIITPDYEYNQYLNTLPDNQRFTPNDKYDSYMYWKLNGKPKNFKEAYDKEMFTFDHSDHAYHANTIAWGEDDNGYFMKPKTHDTVGYELDWFNKGLVTEEGGIQRPETPEEKMESDIFRNNYTLVDDPNRPNYFMYKRKKKSFGGNMYGGTTEKSQKMRKGYVPSDAIRKRIAGYEGKAMTGAIDPLSGRYARNNSFESEAKGFYNALPESIRERVLSNPELADNLYSYSYNVGAGNFKDRVVPALERYYAGTGSADDVASSMWASGDRKLRGLRLRREQERNGVLGALWDQQMGELNQMIDNPQAAAEQPAFMPYDLGNLFPVVPASDAEEGVQMPSEAGLRRQQRDAERQERRDRLQNMMDALNMVYGSSPDNPMGNNGIFSAIGTLMHGDGGRIHIKPENKGKFTALKERTGHSATWFKENGTPAQKKMATFALNARHWKHGEGGNLFDTGGDTGDTPNIFRRPDGSYFYSADGTETDVTPINTLGDNPAYWTYTDAAGKTYTPKATPERHDTLTEAEDTNTLARAANNYFRELSWRAKNDPSSIALQGKYTMPLVLSPLIAPLGEAAVESVPAAASALAPGSSFWMNPITQQMAASTFGGMAVDAATKMFTPYDSWGEGISDVVNKTTGWNPQESWWGSTLADMTNPGYLTPYGAVEKSAIQAAETAGKVVDNGGFAFASPFSNDITWIGRGLGSHIELSPTNDGWLGVDYIQSTRSGNGRRLYDAAIEEAQRRGYKGVKTGQSLASAPKTYRIWEHYPDKTLLSTTGSHGNGNMINGSFTTKVNTPEELIEATNQGIDAAVIRKAPVYGLTTPSNDVPLMSIGRTFQKDSPAAEWAEVGSRQSFLDGKPEIGMYLTPDGKAWDTQRIAKDLGKGIADARLFLGSEMKAASDAHNIELAKRLGFPKFTPYAKAQERTSVYVKPQLTTDKNALAGSVEKNTNDPALDKMRINILYDADKSGFHETLHRGNYGEEGFSFDPKTMNFMDYHQVQEDTRGLYKYKTDKLLVPKTTENAEWHDYMSRSAEAATNSMELGRRMGLEPGTPWPGRKKAMELFEKYATSEDQKTKAFNVLNWKQKPRRVWDALTGRYFILGAGTVSSASLINE